MEGIELPAIIGENFIKIGSTVYVAKMSGFVDVDPIKCTNSAKDIQGVDHALLNFCLGFVIFVSSGASN